MNMLNMNKWKNRLLRKSLFSKKYIVYSFWTGDNTISRVRKNNMVRNHNILNRQGIDYRIITPKNLNYYIDQTGVPLHEGYDYLSLVHKSDYLRCYFMHFFGSGYLDVKPIMDNWGDAFDRLALSQDKFCIGPMVHAFQAASCWSCDTPDRKLHKHLKKNHDKLMNVSAMICKKQTMFTTEWYTKLIEIMDKKLEDLKKYPGRNPEENSISTWQKTNGIHDYFYPIMWTEICADIFHPLCLKYHNKIYYTAPHPRLLAYR